MLLTASDDDAADAAFSDELDTATNEGRRSVNVPAFTRLEEEANRLGKYTMLSWTEGSNPSSWDSLGHPCPGFKFEINHEGNDMGSMKRWCGDTALLP